VTIIRFVFDVGRVDGDLARLLLRRAIDVLVCHGLGISLLGQHLRDGLRQRRLPVVDVSDGPDVHVRLVATEGRRRHRGALVGGGGDRRRRRRRRGGTLPCLTR